MPEGDQIADAPVDIGDVPEAEPAPKPAVFDWNAEMPLDKFPEGMRESLKGKSFEDFAADHAKFRQAASKLGARNKELEAEIEKKSGEKPAELTDEELDAMIQERQDKQIVQGVDYKAAIQSYFDTGEISEEFLDAVATNGARVSRRETLKILAILRQDQEQKIERITAAAEGQLEGQDLWDWMNSGECTLSESIKDGFEEQAEDGNYGWVNLAIKKYNEFLEGGGKQPARRGQGRFSGGPTRRGRAPQPKPGEGDISQDEFSVEWRALSQQQATGQISKADEMKAKKVLEQRRRRTMGE